MKEREVQEAKVCMKNPPNPKPSANTLQGRGERGGSAEDGGPAGGGGAARASRRWGTGPT